MITTASASATSLTTVRSHLGAQNQQLRRQVRELEQTITTLEGENRRLRDRFDASEQQCLARYKEIMSLENEVNYLKVGWDAAAKNIMIKNLREAKASAAAAAAERYQSQQLLRAESLKHHEAEEAARAETQAVYDAAVEDLRYRDNKIAEQETTIRRLHRLIGEQQDQISRLQAEIGREQREKYGVQLVLRSVLPANTSAPPLPTPDLEPLRELAVPGSDQCDEDGRVRTF